MAKPFAWSWSALDMFEQCPKKYYHLKVKKDFREDFSGEVAEYGNRAHKAFELFFDKDKPLPMDLKHHLKRIEKIKQAPGAQYVEQKLALTRKFEPTGYFDSDVWVRGQADYGKIKDTTAIIFDWKFGKMKDVPDQLELMAAMFLAFNEEVDVVIASFYWAQDKQFVPYRLERKDLVRIWNKFLPRVDKVETAIKTTDFPAKTSGLCKRYCPVLSCPHNGKYKP